MPHQNITLPALDRATLRRVVEILTPYRAERLTPAVLALALKIARMEAAR